MKYIRDVVLTEDEYVKPQIEVIDVESEGILAASSDVGSFGDGGSYGEW
jgi:hypothetical protein